MFKKLSILVLIVTAVILPLNFANNLFGTTELVAEAAASDFTDGKKITEVDKVRDGETGNMDSVIAYFYSVSKPGTLIFKIKESSNSSWNSSEKLNLSYLTKTQKNMFIKKYEVHESYALA
ncbi:hypothetical protein WAX74_15050 [Psychrobacillus sp. FJAT-51614]|uniref:Uncharacterized protein n=1 Tax=Psychrobacillus mangrovi TaxID=3117745 RepID=A0ABU8F7F7_9BACI